MKVFLVAILGTLLLTSCGNKNNQEENNTGVVESGIVEEINTNSGSENEEIEVEIPSTVEITEEDGIVTFKDSYYRVSLSYPKKDELILNEVDNSVFSIIDKNDQINTLFVIFEDYKALNFENFEDYYKELKENLTKQFEFVSEENVEINGENAKKIVLKLNTEEGDSKIATQYMFDKYDATYIVTVFGNNEDINNIINTFKIL